MLGEKTFDIKNGLVLAGGGVTGMVGAAFWARRGSRQTRAGRPGPSRYPLDTGRARPFHSYVSSD